ncbi:glycoside hydrolase family 13 protein [Robinsoniella sp. KNHs210]|uniref:glycoside hydrolase family 13 protein n=1 Tax=Robinsoniella sp. KNHs210 TaxID=1469950 RepID=UPI0004830D18|nr:alpha-glucosidase [Robinsoniella sp. KNHs210]
MKQWWKESVVYQIYPRSFADSNGDGIGDLNGITEHLDYLQDLGVDVIWLSPVYQSPNDDNGYDISDYQAIMSDFGTMEDYDRMLSEAHKRGIKIVMDLVVNHTSDEHQWFVESKKSKDNQYRDYYIWKEGKNGKEPNNWGGCFGGSAWEYDKKTDMYFLHCFSKKQPDLNWENPQVRKEVFDMMSWWCEKGIDGFRMDVISMISKDPAFPDGEVRNGLYGDNGPFVCNGPHVHEYLREMNQEVLSKYDIMTVGEAAGVTIEEAKKYAGETTGELNMVFQFEHVELGDHRIGKWSAKEVPLKDLREAMNRWQINLEGKAWNSLFWDNHDQPRAVSRFGDDSPMYREVSAKMLATCLHMMKGTPYIYQGEELGMTNAYFSKLEDYRDIESINAFHEYTENGLAGKEEMMNCLKEISRDNARTPMQWNTKENAGFTTGTPWIKVNKNYLEINAEAEMAEKDSVYNYYKKLIRLRKENEIMVHGRFNPLLEEDDHIYAYERLWEGEKIVVACNFTKEVQACDLFRGLEDGKELISNYKEHKTGVLQPYEAIAVLCKA